MKVLFVFAHPDDESFSSGGTIAKISNKHEVNLICATLGEAGLTGNPSICKQKDLGSVRKKEHRNAADILGIKTIHYLGYIDGTLHKKSIKTTAKDVLQLLFKENPNVIVTFNKEGGSRHPDHMHMSKATTLAFRKYIDHTSKNVKLYYTTNPRSTIKKLEKIDLAYTAFGHIKGMPDSQITTAVDISKTLDKKLLALKCHKTQHQDVERFIKRSKLLDVSKEFFKLILENSLV